MQQLEQVQEPGDPCVGGAVVSLWSPVRLELQQPGRHGLGARGQQASEGETKEGWREQGSAKELCVRAGL